MPTKEGFVGVRDEGIGVDNVDGEVGVSPRRRDVIDKLGRDEVDEEERKASGNPGKDSVDIEALGAHKMR